MRASLLSPLLLMQLGFSQFTEPAENSGRGRLYDQFSPFQSDVQHGAFSEWKVRISGELRWQVYSRRLIYPAVWHLLLGYYVTRNSFPHALPLSGSKIDG
jgi:hypothetical protein